jgi:hypothetical protein
MLQESRTYMTFYKSRLRRCIVGCFCNGQTTNALEIVIKNYFDKSAELNSSVQEVKNTTILMDLFEDDKMMFLSL